MTPNERRARRAKLIKLDLAVTFLKGRPGFAAAQHQAMNRGRELAESLSRQANTVLTPQRFDVALQLLDIRAEAYLPLVNDIPSQEAYMELLRSIGDQAWQDFSGYPISVVHPFGGDPNFIAISKAVSRWTEKGYKRAAEAEHSRALVPVERAPEGPVNAEATIFISYSWDSQGHKEWVRNFAATLKDNGIAIVMDHSHLKLGASATKFMESSVRDCRRVLVICTEAYKQKFDDRKGGAGYEGGIITGEIINQVGENKFVPVLREGDWHSAVPTALSGVYGVDLREDSAEELQRLVDDLTADR
jgi:hypothetical protein